MFMTQHADQRSQQRHISHVQLKWLLGYGEESHNRGVCLYCFDRAGFSPLRRDVDLENQALALRSRNIYAVMADGTVITMGHRDERFKPSMLRHRHREQPTRPARTASSRMGTSSSSTWRHSVRYIDSPTV